MVQGIVRILWVRRALADQVLAEQVALLILQVAQAVMGLAVVAVAEVQIIRPREVVAVDMEVLV